MQVDHLTVSFSFLTGIVFQDNVLSFMPSLRLPEDNECLKFEYSDFSLLKIYHHVAVVPTIIATILSGFLIVEIIAVEFCHNESFKKFANKEIFQFRSKKQMVFFVAGVTVTSMIILFFFPGFFVLDQVSWSYFAGEYSGKLVITVGASFVVFPGLLVYSKLRKTNPNSSETRDVITVVVR